MIVDSHDSYSVIYNWKISLIVLLIVENLWMI